MIRIILLPSKIERALPIVIRGKCIALESDRPCGGNVPCYVRTPEIPTDAHIMKKMHLPNATCNVCMGKNVEWGCTNQNHAVLHTTGIPGVCGFHLCGVCGNLLTSRLDLSELRIPLATVVGKPKGKPDPDNTINTSTAVTVSI